MLVLRVLWLIVAFLVVEVVIWLPLYLVGLLVMPCALRWAATVRVPSRIYPEMEITAFRSRILNYWLGNLEDGLCPDWWARHEGGDSWRARWRWFRRNPVCNLRFVPVIGTKPNPEKVGYLGHPDKGQPDGTPECWYAWQGWYSGFRWQNGKWFVWIGWKIRPEDRLGLDPRDSRRAGIGIACQVYPCA